MTVEFTVQQILAADTHDLRRRVLRNGATDADVEWSGDDDETTVHLGAIVFASAHPSNQRGCADANPLDRRALVGDRIVAISTWSVEPDPREPLVRSVRLRGMATDPSMVGAGLGRALLGEGVRRARSDDHERVWADARVTALGFYESAGWTVTGKVFETAATGLPHRHVHLDLT